MPKDGEYEWDDLFTAQEVADKARVHLKTFMRWCKDGEGPTETRLGHTLRFASSDVRRWLAARKAESHERVA